MTVINDAYLSADEFIKHFNIDPNKYNEEAFKNKFVRTPDTKWLISNILALIAISAGMMLFGSDASLKYVGAAMFCGMFVLFSFMMWCLAYYRNEYKKMEIVETNRITEIREMFASFEDQ